MSAAEAGNRNAPDAENVVMHSSPARKVLVGGVLFVAVCLFAVVGYMVAGWSMGDAAYMVVITIFGVGYGEVQPVDSWPLRFLTTTVIVGGYGAVIFAVGGFIQMMIDGEITSALGARRMSREIDRLEGHTIICGFGRMGSNLAAELSAAGMPFVAIETDPAVLRHAEESGQLAITGDATDEAVLAEAGIERAAALATVLSDDATNVFVTLTARSMNPDLDQAGLELDEIRIDAGSPVASSTIGDIEVRGAHAYLIVGIRRADGSTVMRPDSELVLGVGDTVIVLGYTSDIPNLVGGFAPVRSKVSYRGITYE